MSVVRRYAVPALSAFLALLLPQSCEKPAPQVSPDNEAVSIYLSYPNVTAIAEDATGHIWIGTSRGLNRNLTYGYHHYFAGTDSLSLQDDQIEALYCAQDGRLWVAGNSGAVCYLTEEGAFRQVPIPYRERVRIRFAESPEGDLFCTDEQNVYRFDPALGQMAPFIEGPGRNLGFFVSGDRLILVYGDRVCSHALSDGHLVQEYPFSEVCSSAAMSPDDGLWLSAGEKNKLLILDAVTFDPRPVPPSLAQAIGGKTVVQIGYDRRNPGSLLLNTRDDLLFYESETGEIRTTLERGFSLDHDPYEINCAYLDSKNNVWVGTDGGGVQLLQNIRNWSRFQILTEYFKRMPVTRIEYDDKTETLYVTNHRGSRFAYNLTEMEVRPLPKPAGGLAERYRNGPQRSLLLADGRTLTVEDNVDLMVSSARGDIGYMIPVNKAREALGATHFIPVSLLQDSRGKVWIGTKSEGVVILDLETNSFQAIPDISCKSVAALIEDRQGRVWISTKNGLNAYDKDGVRVNSFTDNREEGGQAYMENSVCMMPDGAILFGTMRGVVIVNPEMLFQPVEMNFSLEDLRVHNELVRPGKDAPIAQAMIYSPTVRLRHDQNSFSISYTLLNYRNSVLGPYSYKLEGFDAFWVDSGNAREAFYTNVPPGHYTFCARVSTSEGEPFGSASCDIIIEPAPWATWYAKLAYVLAVALLFSAAFVTYRRNRRNKEELARIASEKQQEQKMNDIIKKYFANVAHQLRTPLTLISGPIDTLYSSDSFSGRDRELLRMMRNSANRMLNLVNQIMNFHSLESDALVLKVSKCDLVTPLLEAMELYKVNAEKKHIAFLTNGLEGNIFVYADMEKIISILDNLLSNALKFTPQGGSISVSLSYDGTQAQLDVFNSGSTLAEAQQEKIFTRFYQVRDSSGKVEAKGSGVGLYYARKLAVLHHGDLTCKNQGDGVCFTLTLPVCLDAFSSEERQQERSTLPQAPIPVAEAAPEGRPDILKSRVLVVDDDIDITSYLKMLLGPAFQVRCCFDAESALRLLETEAPDLIVSDIMMTGMSGLDFCRQVKGDLQFCHIPLILLTAKDGIQDQIEGLNVGADAYVTKPFNADYLLSLAGNLVRSRARLQQYLSENAGLAPNTDKSLSPQDRSFLNQLYALWDEQLSNPEFNIAAVVEKLHISHTKFIYKVKGLTGFTPSELFKNYKLNKAASMLREGRFNVSEVADLTGFGTPASFSRVFKKKFGVPPSEFK